MRLPLAVDEKLDRLRTLAVQAGERTDRKEIVAALIARCELEGPALSELLREYRTMTVRDAVPDVPADATVLRLADHKPGPRSSRA